LAAIALVAASCGGSSDGSGTDPDQAASSSDSDTGSDSGSDSDSEVAAPKLHSEPADGGSENEADSGDETGEDAEEANSGDDSESAGSSGCGASHETGVSDVEIASGDLERTYRLFVPTSYDPAVDIPLVLNFHGYTGSSEGQARTSGLEELAESEGFIAVHPQGSLNPVANLAFFEFGLGDSGVDDVTFVTDLLDDVESRLCVDTDRIFSMGHSNGGYFSSRLICEASERLAAVATVSATIFPDDCDPSEPTPLIAFHGDADNVVPFDGGPSVFLGNRSAVDIDPVPPELKQLVDLFRVHIADEVGEWAEANGCGPTPVESAEDFAGTLITYEDCDAPVLLYILADGGHGWPNGDPATEVDATAKTWAFFQDQ